LNRLAVESVEYGVRGIRTKSTALQQLWRMPQIIAVLLCLLAAFAATPAHADDGVIKVFVVAAPAQTGGRLPTLQSIARSTLNNQARAGEIFTLNRGLRQPDGGVLSTPQDRLHPGWILRLPSDATGADVRLARDTRRPVSGGPPSSTLTFRLDVALAVLGAVLLAVLTAVIVYRRRLARWGLVIARQLYRFGEPVRRRRRLNLRRGLSRRFAADSDTLRRAYDIIAPLAATNRRPETPVHAVRVDNAGATVWLPASDSLGSPWQHIDSTRWRKPVVGHHSGEPGPRTAVCLVRVGTDAERHPVFVDISRLDGVLAVTGDRTVARDVVGNLLSEIARSLPNIPVMILRSADGSGPPAIPAGLVQVDEPPAPRPVKAQAARGTVRAASKRRPLRGLVVMTGVPATPEAAQLAALCGPGGAGWTGLVCGDVDTAVHWRWRAGSDGIVEIPTLGLQLTVPA
jgi:hypothetical protein